LLIRQERGFAEWQAAFRTVVVVMMLKRWTILKTPIE
jgi:hypothetical protein